MKTYDKLVKHSALLKIKPVAPNLCGLRPLSGKQRLCGGPLSLPPKRRIASKLLAWFN